MFLKIILFGILFFIVLALIMGFTLIKSFFRIFNASKRQNPYQNDRERQQENIYGQQNNQRKKEKIYSKEDGEYIDFEEIKDEDKEKKN